MSEGISGWKMVRLEPRSQRLCRAGTWERLAGSPVALGEAGKTDTS